MFLILYNFSILCCPLDFSKKWGQEFFFCKYSSLTRKVLQPFSSTTIKYKKKFITARLNKTSFINALHSLKTKSCYRVI